MTSKEERKKMLKLAREAIINNNDEKKREELSNKRLFDRKAGVFVSVYVNDDLRGCIGNLDAADLQDSTIKNAVHAAYNDGRFPPIRKSEFKDMKIHINILSEPKIIIINDAEDLLKKLDEKPGLIIRKGFATATFLPSVWEQLPEKEQFLSHLCMKAGLMPSEWKKPGMSFYEYYSEEFSD